MRKLLIGAAVALPAACLPAAFLSVPVLSGVPTSAGTSVEARPDLAALVRAKDVEAHLRAFQEIADYNGGNRASGGAGYDVSVKYVVGRLRKAGFTPRIQRFTHPYWRERSDAVLARTEPSKATYQEGRDFRTFAYSGSGDVTARVTAVDLPSKGDGTSGCEKRDFADFPKGSIALLQRGSCTFEAKAAKAKDAGASAVVIYNGPGERGPVNGTLSAPSTLPVVGPSHKVGAALAKAADKGGLHLRVRTDTVHGKRRTANVIADTEQGRGDNVVLVGAHLDSVPAGPGINDNGTGAAALLAIAAKIRELGEDGLRNRVRFAWWGAEEEGLRGSTHYVKSLSPSDRKSIALALNFDMLGSVNGTRGVYDGDHSVRAGVRAPAGSGAIEKMFRDYFERRHLPTTEHVFDGRSDYGQFVEAGIPAGGMATGAEGVKTAEEAKAFGGSAGKPYDPCYHKKCDRLKNVNLKLLDSNVDGIAHVTQHLARTTVAVNGGARLRVGDGPSDAPVRRGSRQVR
ncbi:PA domain-containing protein [Actinomadura pelletieri DSM 43383]|uniref:PA domain-containing protein n=1 Tax=Actinomadura pelletieri DSM 43383 TaxID=1120940 RepID=A0A495QTI8_9ACTN|nr:M28 family peptidase [Actinomadura pelletieri]RKS76768.1 PA domain-containing protein [Actinomadura pelletieri DSM 43383]